MREVALRHPAQDTVSWLGRFQKPCLQPCILQKEKIETRSGEVAFQMVCGYRVEGAGPTRAPPWSPGAFRLLGFAQGGMSPSQRSEGLAAREGAQEAADPSRCGSGLSARAQPCSPGGPGFALLTAAQYRTHTTCRPPAGAREATQVTERGLQGVLRGDSPHLGYTEVSVNSFFSFFFSFASVIPLII